MLPKFILIDGAGKGNVDFQRALQIQLVPGNLVARLSDILGPVESIGMACVCAPANRIALDGRERRSTPQLRLLAKGA